MKLGSHTNYHGSRAYAPDLPTITPGRWLKGLAGPLTASAKYLLEMLVGPDARQGAETIWLVRREERHFTILGSRPGPRRRRAARPLWPEGEARFRRPIERRGDGE